MKLVCCNLSDVLNCDHCPARGMARHMRWLNRVRYQRISKNLCFNLLFSTTAWEQKASVDIFWRKWTSFWQHRGLQTVSRWKGKRTKIHGLVYILHIYIVCVLFSLLNWKKKTRCIDSFNGDNLKPPFFPPPSLFSRRPRRRCIRPRPAWNWLYGWGRSKASNSSTKLDQFWCFWGSSDILGGKLLGKSSHATVDHGWSSLWPIILAKTSLYPATSHFRTMPVAASPWSVPTHQVLHKSHQVTSHSIIQVCISPLPPGTLTLKNKVLPETT